MTIQPSTFTLPPSLIDPRCPWVQVHPAPVDAARSSGGAWRLIAFKYEDDRESGGNHHIYVRLLNADGAPAAGVKVTHGWPSFTHPDDSVTLPTDTDGNVNWAMWGNATINDRNPRGPYWICPAPPADMVDGMGLPSNHHVNYRLTFRWTDVGDGGPSVPSPGDVGDECRFVPLWYAAYAATKVALGQEIAFTFQGDSYHAICGTQLGILARRDCDAALLLIFPDEVKAIP